MIEEQLALCLVTNAQAKPFSQYKEIILQAVAGGVTLIQLREKSKNFAQVRQIALELKAILAPLKVPLIINDYVEIVKEIDADGVHLGQSDLSPSDARAILGPNKIIGWSIESFEELEIANQLTCIDYIAVSAVFPSKTKPDCKTIWGLDGLLKITKKSKHPVVAIGGINQQNICDVIDNGASGAAVVSAIHCHNDPKEAANQLISEIYKSIYKQEENMFEKTKETMNRIKLEKPLVLNITNYVTMDFIANGLLSIGASPIMSKAAHEIEDLLQHAKSIVINLGTLNNDFIRLCKHTCKIANQLSIPIILDPVGAGASQYRTDTCMSLINEYPISIIRGNASEIIALSGSSCKIKGVDSITASNHAVENAKRISKRYNAAVVVSGKIDIIVDDESVDQFNRGSPFMPYITGTGCLLSAVIAAFHAIEKNRFDAAKMATLFYGISGEIAENSANGPGSFRTQFLDALHRIPDRGQYGKK